MAADIDDLPDAWFVDNDGQRLVLDVMVVADEVCKLRQALRDQFATAIICGVTGGWIRDEGAMRELARRAYRMADIMIEERTKSGS